MSDMFKELMGSLPESMRWKPPEPDADAQAKREYKDLVGNYYLERFRDRDYSAEMPKPFDAWLADRKATEAAARERAEAPGKALAEAIEDRKEAERVGTELAALEKRLATAEAKAKIAKIDEYCKAKGWDPRGPKRAKAVSQMHRAGLLNEPKGEE